MIGVAHLITGLETGGAERVLVQLVAGADPSRCRSTVISMTDIGPMGSAIAKAGVPVHALGMRRGLPDPRALPRLRGILRGFQPDILQTWLYHADLLGLAARLLGFAPHLLWNVRCTDSRDSRALRALLALASGQPDAVIVNSEAGRRFHEGLGYRPRRWALLPNGFDTAALRPDPERRARLRGDFGWDDAIFAIALPARHHPMKDHATFLAAAARLAAANLRFVLIGSGNDRGNGQLADAIAESGLGDRVVLLGERDDLHGLYCAFDIVTLSSAYGEGFPNVLGEAMSCGVPCVATDIGDSREIIGDTGELVPPRDPAALAAAWERLAALGPTERAARGAAARERIVARFGLAAIVGRYVALYEEIAAR